jgi:hypothetical protein
VNAITGLLSAFGLSTAAGLNAYIPLLVIGLLDRYTDLVRLSAPYDVLANPWVLLVIALLALVDFVGDKVPAVDHAFHAVGMVVHPVAGAIMFMAANASAGAVNPVLAAICGLLLAGVTHTARAAARPVATATTAGLANPVVSLVEDIGALALSVMAVLLPLLAFLVALGGFLVLIFFVRRIWPKRPAGAERR